MSGDLIGSILPNPARLGHAGWQRENYEEVAELIHHLLDLAPGPSGGWGGPDPRLSVGTGARPAPRVRSTGGGDGCRWHVPNSRTPERDREVAHALARLDPHQHGPLAFAARIGQRLAHVGWLRNRLSGDVENDVARLEAVIAAGTARIDRGDHHAFAAGAGDLSGRCEAQAKLRKLDASGVARLGPVIGLLPILGQFAQGQRHGLLGALAQQRDLHAPAARHTSDPLREVARLLDRP